MVLISNFIEYFKVDVEWEVVEAVKSQNELIGATLNKIGLKKANDDYWACKADGEGVEQQQYQEDDGAGTSVFVATVGGWFDPAQFAYMTDNPSVEGEGSFSRFEQMMISPLHTIENEQRSHHQFSETCFQNIEDQVEDIQHKIW